MLIRRSEIIEVIVPANNTTNTIKFPDQAQLRNANVNGIKLLTPGAFLLSPISFSPLLPIADLQRCFMTLYSGDIQLCNLSPVLCYQDQVTSAADPYVFQLPNLNNLIISWTKSILTFATAPAPEAQNVVAFEVYYSLPSGS